MIRGGYLPNFLACALPPLANALSASPQYIPGLCGARCVHKVPVLDYFAAILTLRQRQKAGSSLDPQATERQAPADIADPQVGELAPFSDAA